VLLGTDKEGVEFQQLCIKHRQSLLKGDDREVFWLAGPKSDIISKGFGSGISMRKELMLLIFMVSYPMKQSHSEARKVKSLHFPIISDSSDNPFYMAPLLHVSTQTPGNIYYEKPTVTYVL